MSHDHDQDHEPVPYSTYFFTWFALLILTAITVTAAGMHFGNMSAVVALVIALVKASIVFAFFMHIKYEDALFHKMIVIVALTMVIFIGLTFTDTLFR